MYYRRCHVIAMFSDIINLSNSNKTPTPVCVFESACLVEMVIFSNINYRVNCVAVFKMIMSLSLVLINALSFYYFHSRKKIPHVSSVTVVCNPLSDTYSFTYHIVV